MTIYTICYIKRCVLIYSIKGSLMKYEIDKNSTYVKIRCLKDNVRYVSFISNSLKYMNVLQSINDSTKYHFLQIILLFISINEIKSF